MSKIAAVLHSEIVGLYSGLNAIIGALVVLNVVTLTPDQIAALLVIANVVLGPVVRALVTPTAVRVIPPPPPPPGG